ncbi:MAG: flagellar basal body rod protein FlgB [Candidatus Binatia bacterium]
MEGFRLFGFTHQLLELSMRARGARHEVLSANIANADTPGFRPRDLDFESVIRTAMELDDHPISREQQMDELLSGLLGFEGAIYEPATDRQHHGEERLDGNRVSLDRQIALLNENALSYEANLTFFSRALAKLRYVISDGRS